MYIGIEFRLNLAAHGPKVSETERRTKINCGQSIDFAMAGPRFFMYRRFCVCVFTNRALSAHFGARVYKCVCVRVYYFVQQRANNTCNGCIISPINIHFNFKYNFCCEYSASRIRWTRSSFTYEYADTKKLPTNKFKVQRKRKIFHFMIGLCELLLRISCVCVSGFSRSLAFIIPCIARTQ